MHSFLMTRSFLLKKSPQFYRLETRGFSNGLLLKGKNPMFQLRNIQEDPSKGYSVNVTCFGAAIEFSHAPQMGPPKTDPNDEMPQFNMQERIFFRPKRSQYLELLAVTSGKLNSAEMSTLYGANITFAKTSTGFTLKIDTPTKHEAEGKRRQCEVHFTNQYAAALKNFIEFTLHKSFGFENRAGTNGNSREPGPNLEKNRRRRANIKRRKALQQEKEQSMNEKSEKPTENDESLQNAKENLPKEEGSDITKGKKKKSKGKKSSSGKKEKPSSEDVKVDEIFDSL